jgi:hypothetical protein
VSLKEFLKMKNNKISNVALANRILENAAISEHFNFVKILNKIDIERDNVIENQFVNVDSIIENHITGFLCEIEENENNEIYY